MLVVIYSAGKGGRGLDKRCNYSKSKLLIRRNNATICKPLQYVLACVSFYRHVSVAPATIIENTNDVQMLAQKRILKPTRRYRKCLKRFFHNFAHVSLRLSTNIKSNIYIIIILPVVFYGCATWSLTLREERR